MSDRPNSQQDVYGLDQLAETMADGGALFKELPSPEEAKETRSELKLVVDNPEEKTA